MSVLTVAGRPLAVGGRASRVRDWGDVIGWSHSWDWNAGIHDHRRLHEIPDPAGAKPLRLMPGSFPLLGGSLADVGPLPGPLWIRSSARFNGRSACRFDRFPIPGSVFHTFSGLSPNVDRLGTSGVENDANYFNAPLGYPQPYWVAVLGRLDEPDTEGGSDTDPAGLWDATHGGVGTGPTIGRKIIGLGNPEWQTSNFGPDLELIAVAHTASPDETVLVIAYLNGASSFLEVTWRTAGGTLTTLRQTGSQPGHTFLECFGGWVHGPYLSAAGIVLGPFNEADGDKVRSFAGYYIPPAGPLAEEP